MKKYLILLASVLAITGCSDDEATEKRVSDVSHQQYQQEQYQQGYAQPQPQYAPAPAQPIIVQQPATQVVHDNSGSDMLTGALLGGMAGYAMGNSGSDRGSSGSYDRRPATVVNKTVVNKTVVNKTVNTKPVTKTVAKPAPKPVYKSYKSKPSYYKPTYKRSSYKSSSFRKKR